VKERERERERESVCLFTRHCTQTIKISQRRIAFPEVVSLASEARLPRTSVTKVSQVAQGCTVVASSYGLSPRPQGGDKRATQEYTMKNLQCAAVNAL